MTLTGENRFLIRGFIVGHGSKFIDYCKDESISEEEFINLLEELDFNEIVTPELLANFRRRSRLG